MTSYRKAICKIKIYIDDDLVLPEKGTGFFISENLILTSNHVIEKSKGPIEISKCHNQNGSELTAKVIDICQVCDYALLQLNEKFVNEYYLELCDSEIIEEENIRIFGFPDDPQGQDLGENLKGTIAMKAENDAESVQDVILSIESFAHNSRYSGFSGSPVINEYEQVTSLLKYQATRGLSSVSIKKASSFLEKNRIEVKPDQLQSFEAYNKGAFLGFEDRRSECEIESIKPLKRLMPQTIIESNRGELFYPEKSQPIGELIKHLRKSKDINSKLWQGWIQLLTYVEILKGNNASSNNISIDITSNELVKRFGVFNTSKTVNIKLHLNFYFTEEESYFKIASKSIHENNKKGFVNHTCNVFNSTIENFGNTYKHIPDISNPEGSGPTISKLKIGALSLSTLNREVISSNSLGEVSDNLKKIFEDAIN